MAYEIIIEPEAEIEINEAHQWYEQQSEGLGEEFLRALEAGLFSIRRTPLLYPKVRKQARRLLLRKFPYVVIYLLDKRREKIFVLACLHGHRDPRKWQDRI